MNSLHENRLTVKEAAKLLGCGEQTIRMGLQQVLYNWGYAVKTSSFYTYVILASKFYEENKIKPIERGDWIGLIELTKRKK